ncbi:MAG: ABC transporter ATP-binding protein [Pseudohongiella sp.]|nr:ABC transporter ATP-binding protein [Pseudohongiella sp.]
MIEISHLTKNFDQFTAIDDLSFTVKEGEVLGFLGPNGAGKSTTMKVITGFLSPSSGTVTIDGHDISTSPMAAKSLMGYLPEGAPSYGDMTTLEFLNFIAQVRGYRGEEIARRVQHAIDEVELASVSQQTIDTLSKGFKRRVGLAQAIMHDPKVLILDEPTDGLDPNQKHHVRELIKNLARDKIVIISTHILEEVTAVCSRAIIISQGKIVADGTPAELESRSKYHQAVSVRLTDDYDLEADLANLPDVAAVEKDEENKLTFTILAKEGKSIFSQVSEIAQSKQWPVTEFHVSRGQLEDVFRTVTQQSTSQQSMPQQSMSQQPISQRQQGAE